MLILVLGGFVIRASTAAAPMPGALAALQSDGQFGWYGPQSGDNPAAISLEEQQEQIVAATLALLSGRTDQGP